MSMERLQKLPEHDVLTLLHSLEGDHYEDSLHALCFLRQVVEWRSKSPDLDYSVYSPHGDFTDSTFILLLTIKGGIFTTYFSRSERGCLRLREALLNTSLFSADCYCVMTSIPERVHCIVGTEWRRRLAGPEQLVQDCHCFLLPEHTALSLSPQCPEEVYVRDLTLDDAELINSEWPHRNAISLSLIRGIISTSTCIGLCSKETGRLVSWALRWYYGGIGVVQTLPEFKRRGYAQIVCSVLAKRMAQDNWPIHLVIIDGNVQSTSLFTKMGFVELNFNNWFYYHVFDK